MKQRIATALLALSLTIGARAQGAWETISNPETNKGLVLSMKLIQFRNRVWMFWAGTSQQAIAPEVFFTTRSDGEDSWKVSRAPFFGRDFGRVRRLTAATARDMMIILFERESTQGNGAMEVLLSVSPDSGYTFNTPFVMDSFVLHDSNGASLAAAARQGTKRPEFACVWVAEGGSVRLANVDPRSGYRPEAISVGDVADLQDKVDVVGAGSEGFYGVWPEQGGLRTAHLKPLTGGTDPTKELAKGSFAKAWCTAWHYRGPGALVLANEGGTMSTMGVEGSIKETMPSQRHPVTGRHLEARACMDEDKNIHMAVLDDHRIWYTTNKGGKWTDPESVMDLPSDVPMTGFDIVATDSSILVGGAARQILKMARRKMPG